MGGIVSICTVVATSERRRGAILPEAVFGALSELHTACIFKTPLKFIILFLWTVTLKLNYVLDPLGQLFQMTVDKEAQTLCTWVPAQRHYEHGFLCRETLCMWVPVHRHCEHGFLCSDICPVHMTRVHTQTFAAYLSCSPTSVVGPLNRAASL